MTAKSVLNDSAQVDSYIAAAPVPAQPILRQLRDVIRAAAPTAEERISYGMPSYEHHGRLVYFAAFKNHVGLYAIGQEHDSYVKELSGYLTGRSTARFPIGQPLPVASIRKVVQARVKENESQAKAAARTSMRKARTTNRVGN
jgi:uncharacterized protein YdhG (YjbR/CyaY superfamily)